MGARDFLDSDYPAIEGEAPEPGANEGISAGSGMLASMMSWIRKAVTRRSDVEPVVAAGPGAGATTGPASVAPFVPMKSTGADGEFDAAELMRGILAYHERYKSRLYGAGLIFGLEADMPPAAFPEVAALPGFMGAADSLSLLASDYQDLDAAHQAILKSGLGSGLKLESPRQIAWLINAACVRGAVDMAAFALGTPEIKVLTGSESNSHPAALMFQTPADSGLGLREVLFPGAENPLGLGRAARTQLGEMCLHGFRRAGSSVALEFRDAVCAAARIPTKENGFERFTDNLKDIVLRAGPMGRLSRSYVAFSDLPGVIKADKAFQATLSRRAMVDALRHGTLGFQLSPYLAHTSKAVQAEVDAQKHLGALALGHYSTETLSALAAGHIALRVSFSITSDGEVQAAPDGLASSALTMLGALEASLSERARAALAAVSPRYLSPLVFGAHRASPIASHDALLHSPLKQEAAGRRLGLALSQLLDASPSAKLPWVRALVSTAAVELMTEGDDDAAATRALTTVFGVANTLRSQSHPHAVLDQLPYSSSFLEAPEKGPVKSVMRLMQMRETKVTALKRTSNAVLREVLADLPATMTTYVPGGDKEDTAAVWEPMLAGIAPAGTWEYDQLEVAFRSTHGRKESWFRSMVMLSTASDDRPDSTHELKISTLLPHEPFGKVFDAKRTLQRDDFAVADLRPLSGAR